MSNIQIIFSDDYLMILDKPPGLVVTPADTVKDQQTLSDILISDYQINLDRGGVVHRLDKDTSGLLVIAKTQESLESLQLQFKERMVKKQYIALVHGFLKKEEKVQGAIERNPKNREKFTVLESGKEAETLVKPVANYQLQMTNYESIFEDFNKIQLRKLERIHYNEFTLVECFPLTGRTHQIRVHLKYINHPIVGDEKYVGRKTGRLDRRFCKRQFLHAKVLEFYHPKDGRKMSFESNLPEDLKEVLDILEPIKISAS